LFPFGLISSKPIQSKQAHYRRFGGVSIQKGFDKLSPNGRRLSVRLPDSFPFALSSSKGSESKRDTTHDSSGLIGPSETLY